MSEMKSYLPSTFCWFDLGTTHPAAAKQFYNGLFGWNAVDVPAGPEMVYTMLQVDGKNVAALYQQDQQQQAQGIPPCWTAYVSVTSADEIAAKTTALGGTVLMEPMDVMDQGRMILIQDPTGAVVGAWQPFNFQGADLVGDPGSVCWTELSTTDRTKAGPFYSEVFNWQAKEEQMGPTLYTTFYAGEQMSAGMFQLTPEMGNIPSNWLSYFAVSDCDASAARTTELGGQVLMPPTDIPSIGRFAVLQDPQGAVFAIITMSMP
jgi:uncharacterized protein